MTSTPPPDQYLDAVFAPGGALSQAFPGYRPRPGQIAYANAVDRAIATNTHLLVEGPCGIGKSVGYAVPATYHALRTKQTTILVTANIALQEQLVGKDLPMLQSILPWKFTFASMKGRNNFLCTDKLDVARLPSTSFEELDGEGKRQLPILRAWAEEEWRAFEQRSKSQPDPRAYGDVSQLSTEPPNALWRRFSVSSDECKGKRCRRKNACFANHANDQAKAANIVVTNYHMLFSHLAVWRETRMDYVLPPFHVAILDEAHKAADIARDFFGFKVSVDKIKRIARWVRRDQANLADACERAAVQLFHLLHALRKDQTRYKARLILLKIRDDERDAWKRLVERLKEVVACLDAIREAAQATLARDPTNENAEDGLGQAERRVDQAKETLHHLMAPWTDEDDDFVYSLEEDNRGRVSILCKLVRASQALRPFLFNKTVDTRNEEGKFEQGERITVIATSATLATDQGSFAYAQQEMGVNSDECETAIGESPFDWPNQCLMIVPKGMPDPNDASFRPTVGKMLERIVLYAGGRTLGLFTSRRGLEDAYNALFLPCRNQGFTLLKQGDAPRTQLIRTFREDVTSVLLGTESFWAGVDVPGEALSVVVIDRIPFPTPDDPILDALSETDDAAFFKYAVPRAILAFRQGFGRLIRSSGDRGVVVCLDPRIATKRYGKQILRALPPVPKSEQLDSMVDWLFPPKTAFVLTDPDLDAPDGAVVDGFERHSDRWMPQAPPVGWDEDVVTVAATAPPDGWDQ